MDIGRSLYTKPGRREEFIRLMQENDTLSGFESQIYRKDGSTIWISENCRAIRDRTTQVLYYEGTVEDITQRRQVEEKLRDSEALYQSLVETLPQNIFRKDLQERFTFGNQQFCKVLGHPLKEIIGKTDFDFFPRELAEKYQRDDRKVIQTGKPFTTVEEHRAPGQSTIYVQVVKTPLIGPNGDIIGLQGIFWDITEQRMAEEKIRRVNTLLAQNRKELRARNRQMQEDLKMAQDVQLTMLPQQYPSIPSSNPSGTSAFQFTHRYLPTGTVGGDFFSISALSETEAGVFICDVAGHGVRSALVTGMVRALVEELKACALDPGQFLTKLNRDLFMILQHSGSPLLTTAFYLVADSTTGLVRFANAGHPKPIHVQRDLAKIGPLANSSGKSQPALGLLQDCLYQTSSTTLAHHDLVMLFTDGLYEVQNVAGELYSQALLTGGVEKLASLPAPKLFDALLGDIRQFSGASGFSDDVCLVALEYA